MKHSILMKKQHNMKIPESIVLLMHVYLNGGTESLNAQYSLCCRRNYWSSTKAVVGPYFFQFILLDLKFFKNIVLDLFIQSCFLFNYER